MLFIKVPPPSTGVTLMNKYVQNSRLIREKYNLRSLEVSYSNHVSELGKINSYKLFLFVKIFFALIYEIISFKPVLVYFQISTTGLALYRDIVFSLLVKAFRKNILFHLHGKGLEAFAAKNRINRFLLIKTFGNEKIICLSELVKHDITNILDCNPYIVPDGIREIDRRYVVEKSRSSAVPVILYYSNFSKIKGISVFLDAIEILKKENIKFTALIAGRESDYKILDIEKVIGEKNIADVVKVIAEPDEIQKYALYSEADIFIFPTQFEAFGLVVLEAMQFSLPVIASKEGSIPMIINENKTGLLFRKDSPEELAEKIKILISDAEMRIRLGRNGRKKYESEFTYGKFEKNMAYVLDDVLSATMN